MFDFSWSEILVVGAVALVVIGPKDLPKALKTAGMVVRRARGLAREFQNSIDDMIRESEIDEIRRSVQQATTGNFDQTIHKTIDPEGHLTSPLFSSNPAAATPVAEAAPAMLPKPAELVETPPREVQPEPHETLRHDLPSEPPQP